MKRGITYLFLGMVLAIVVGIISCSSKSTESSEALMDSSQTGQSSSSGSSADLGASSSGRGR